MRTAVGSLALVAALAAAPVPSARAGWWDDLDKGDPVKLSDLVARPHDYEGKRVTFSCVYHWQDQVYFPYFTSFTPAKHLNFTVWYDGWPVWEREAYANDFPFLYLERSHPQRDELLRLERFARIEVTGKVRDVYREKPWIEVLGFRATPATLGEAVVVAMKSGDRWSAEGDWVRAEAYYRRALADPALEESYRLRVQKRIADVMRAAGRTEEAAASPGAGTLGGTDAPTPTGSLPPEGAGSIPSPSPASEPAPGSASGGTAVPGRWVPDPSAPESGAPGDSAAPGALTEDLPGTPVGQPTKPTSPTPAPRTPVPPAPSAATTPCPPPAPSAPAAPPAPPAKPPVPSVAPAVAPAAPASPTAVRAGDVATVHAPQGAPVRAEARADARVLATLPYGSRPRIVDAAFPWARVGLEDGTAGWVWIADLLPPPAAPTRTPRLSGVR